MAEEQNQSDHQLQIPNVTQQDLDAFHALHFAPSVQAARLYHTDQHKPTEGPANDGCEDRLDDLGYYHDGVKRTLTDEQIAIFRHSEIQQLLKEKRRRRAELEEEAEAYEQDLRPNYSSTTIEGGVEAAASARGAESRQGPPDGAMGKGEDREIPGRKRRKQEMKSERQKAVQEQKTCRRLARELDEAQATTFELDY